MSTAAALLEELQACGVELQADGDRLRYRPESALTPDLAERLKAAKAELIALLAGPEPYDAGREVARFIAVAVPYRDGRGWYDPDALRTPAGRIWYTWVRLTIGK